MLKELLEALIRSPLNRLDNNKVPNKVLKPVVNPWFIGTKSYSSMHGQEVVKHITYYWVEIVYHRITIIQSVQWNPIIVTESMSQQCFAVMVWTANITTLPQPRHDSTACTRTVLWSDEPTGGRRWKAIHTTQIYWYIILSRIFARLVIVARE